MNRLYLLGALAFSQVATYIDIGSYGQTYQSYYNNPFAKYAYTSIGDCFSISSATSLGLNNIYNQYYYFYINAATVVYSTFTISDVAPITSDYTDTQVSGCIHEHLYNWMAQPAIGSSSVNDGIGEALVAYGYIMTDSTLANCALIVKDVTTTLYSSTTKIFTGARFQHVQAILTPVDSIVATQTISYLANSMITHYGQASLYTKSVTGISTFISTNSAGADLFSSSNSYFDFAQQQIVLGQTQFGRGGGDPDIAPCGWWVFYVHEGGLMEGGASSISNWNLPTEWKSITVHMWTDNDIINTISILVFVALCATLYQKLHHKYNQLSSQ